MANSETLVATNDPLNVLAVIPGLGVTTYSATLAIDYAAGTATGPLTLNITGIGLVSFTPLTLSQSVAGGTGVNTITGTSTIAGDVATLTFSYTGQAPTAANVSVNANVLGASVPILSGTNTTVTSTPPPCFAAGTLIRTPHGDVAVEDLMVSDLVTTAEGVDRPILWISHKTVDCRVHPRPSEVLPVRIAADAFAPGKPDRDLFVSPGHAICINVLDEVLMPASVLVNGSTVAQVDVDEVTYWHVELDCHDILLANNLPTESYIDVGNREFFTTGRGPLDPDRDAATLTDYCRPFVTDEALVTAVRRQLRTRAVALGWSLDERPSMDDLQVVADGHVIRPDILDLTARFVIPATAKDVWLVSETSVPSHISDMPDARHLGVPVHALTIDDGLTPSRGISIEDPLLCVGFHNWEAGPDGGRRWTAGRARLPAELWNDCHGHFFLRLELGGRPLPRWIAPTRAKSDVDAGSYLSLVKTAA